MLTHLFSMLGLAGLCALWVAFQLWLKRVDPDGRALAAGCGHCKGGACRRNQTREPLVATSRERQPSAGLDD